MVDDKIKHVARTISIVLLSISVLGCAASRMTVNKRGTGEMGFGLVEGRLGGQKINVTLGVKSCSGEYALVADGGGFGLINTFARSGKWSASGLGISSWSSSTVTAAAILPCSDSDVWRCEFKADMNSRSGFGICQGTDEQIYDFMVKP